MTIDPTLQVEFLKPPPKKKWLQSYIKQDPCSISSDLRQETQNFAQLFDDSLTEASKQQQLDSNKNSPKKITLSKDVIGGVVQGVIDQFQTFFENDCSNVCEPADDKPTAPKISETSEIHVEDKGKSKEDEVKGEQLSQKDIAPVVQSVISQFLNGSLPDSGFRRSRKRTQKHINCHHQDKSGSAGAVDRQRRSSSVIRFGASSGSAVGEPAKPSPSVLPSPIKVRKIETLTSSVIIPAFRAAATPLPPIVDSNTGALNLCLRPEVRREEEGLSSRFQPVQPVQPVNLSRTAAPLRPRSDLFSAPARSPPVFPLLSPAQPAYNSFSVVKPTPIKPIFNQVAGLNAAPTTKTLSKPILDYPRTLGFKSQTEAKPVKPVSPCGEVSRKEGESGDSSAKEEIKRTSSSTREVHNRLEKNRRAQLKTCFDELAAECGLDAKKASNLLVIRSAYKCIMGLRREERQQERNLSSLVQEKIRQQSRLEQLRRELGEQRPCGGQAESDGE